MHCLQIAINKGHLFYIVLGAFAKPLSETGKKIFFCVTIPYMLYDYITTILSILSITSSSVVLLVYTYEMQGEHIVVT